MPSSLHAALQRGARQEGLSLNEYCCRKLAISAAPTAFGPGAELLERAQGLHGADLVGLLVFGSWARGEAGPTSDVDVLVVLDPARPLSRALYRGWDEHPLRWEGHPVEPHLVHLPEAGAVGSVWAEAAIDGLVLHERALCVSRALAAVRREIAEGRLVRRTVHGQPYWAKVV